MHCRAVHFDISGQGIITPFVSIGPASWAIRQARDYGGDQEETAGGSLLGLHPLNSCSSKYKHHHG